MMGLVLMSVATLIAGFLSGRMSNKTYAKRMVWILPVIAVLVGYLLMGERAAGEKMFVLIFLLFLGMKSVANVYRFNGKSPLSFVQWLCFSLLWPGMDAFPFCNLGKGNLTAGFHYVKTGMFYFIVGALSLYFLAFLLSETLIPPYWVGLLSFPCFIMIFHLGLFNIIAWILDLLGVKAEPIMNAPWRSQSLGEFWGKRWNLAFIQMMRITLFVPLSRKTNSRTAFLVSFLLSGIFHEVALSLPVNSGYGLPTLYFLLQSLLILIEKRIMGRRPLVVRRLWTFCCLLLPSPLLFHPAFLSGIFLPFLQSLYCR